MTVVDTNILIYFLEHHPRLYPIARQVLETAILADGSFACSAVSITEILRGPVEYSDIVDFFKQPQVVVLSVDVEIALLAGQLSQRHHLKTPDAIIVATALYHPGAQLITNDRQLLKLNLPITITGLPEAIS